MAIETFQCARHSFISRVYRRAHHGWARRNNFQNKGSHVPGKRYFLDTVVHKRASLLIFQLEFTENVIYILSYPESIVGPTMVGLGETIFII